MLETDRFLLRELQVEDVSERYLSWFRDPLAAEFICSAPTTKALDDLRAYIRGRTGREDILFLGIFDKQTQLHIGNVKYEPVDSRRGYAVMGILIGDPAYRGKGVSREVLVASAAWLRDHRGIREIVLGVTRANAAAVRSYEAAGFVMEATPHLPTPDPANVTMVLHL